MGIDEYVPSLHWNVAVSGMTMAKPPDDVVGGAVGAGAAVVGAGVGAGAAVVGAGGAVVAGVVGLGAAVVAGGVVALGAAVVGAAVGAGAVAGAEVGAGAGAAVVGVAAGEVERDAGGFVVVGAVVRGVFDFGAVGVAPVSGPDPAAPAPSPVAADPGSPVSTTGSADGASAGGCATAGDVSVGAATMLTGVDTTMPSSGGNVSPGTTGSRASVDGCTVVMGSVAVGGRAAAPTGIAPASSTAEVRHSTVAISTMHRPTPSCMTRRNRRVGRRVAASSRLARPSFVIDRS